MVGERVFLRRVGVEDAREPRAFGREFRELEVTPRFEPNQEDALAVLRHHFLRVDHLPIDLIPEGVGQRVVNDLEGAALVVPDEVLHVLQHEGARLVVVENVGDGEEEVALFLVREAVLAAEAVLLGDTREAKGLAGKTTAENVMGRDVFDIDLVDIACRFLAEVGGVGLPAEPVPVAGEDALRPARSNASRNPPMPQKRSMKLSGATSPRPSPRSGEGEESVR